MSQPSPTQRAPALDAELPESLWLRYFRIALERWGRGWTSAGITFCSVLMSIVITYGMGLAMVWDASAMRDAMITSVIVPLCIAPIVTLAATAMTTRLLALESRLRDQAMRDALTGVPNRRWIMDRCQAAEGRPGPTRTPIGVLMIDIDHFKHINDRYGHYGGDVVLCAVARELAARLRPNDCVGRYGGEEFLMLTTDRDEARLVDFGQLLRRSIEDLRLPEIDEHLRVSVSIGATLLEPDTDTTIQGALSEADRALYAAKGKGRNRVELGSRVRLPEPAIG